MSYYKFIPFLCLLVVSCSNSKEVDTSFIQGKWVGDSTVYVNQGVRTQSKFNSLLLTFKTDTMYWGRQDRQGYYRFIYAISDDTLVINGEKMELLKLTDSELVFQRNIEDEVFDVGYYHREK